MQQINNVVISETTCSLHLEEEKTAITVPFQHLQIHRKCITSRKMPSLLKTCQFIAWKCAVTHAQPSYMSELHRTFLLNLENSLPFFWIWVEKTITENIIMDC